MGVFHAEGDESSSGGRGEVGGKVVRVLLGGSDGSDGSIKGHVAGGVEGLHVEGGRVKGGVQSVFGVCRVLEVERFLSQGFKIGGEDLVELEGLERGVVEADNRTDGSSRFVNLGLSVQL